LALNHAEPGEVVNLQSGAPAGSKTAALVKRDRFEAVRLVVPAGITIPTHQVGGFVTLYCLEGHAMLAAHRDIEMRSGDWVYLDRNAPHAASGIEDSALLLTILFD
jgi:quercetin dioxygenase-like cupin family protein